MELKKKIEQVRAFYRSGATLSYAYRVRQLKNLKQSIIKYEKEIAVALMVDLNKSDFETYMTETGIVLSELTHMISKLSSYMKPKSVSTPLALFPAKSFISSHPYGVCLILSPWNYPFQLIMNPLIAAIAAGNAVILKPSAYAPQTASLLKKMIGETFDENFVQVVTGGREANSALLEQKWDLIFFTGSPAVGRVVMERASQNLTPVILELGGKSPAIVTKTANLKLAAKRIAFGKILNAGQICVAPDFAYVDALVQEEFLSYLIFYFNKFAPEGAKTRDLPKIINKKHFDRLQGLLKGESIVHGGGVDGEKIAPTILYPLSHDSKIMQEEIFGPILPVLTYTSESEMLQLLQSKPHPLALYLFTGDSKTEKRILNHLQFGGGCINDTIVHLANQNLPFGGVGNSGMGAYHGERSFKAFSHERSIVKTSTFLDIPLRYRPYTTLKKRLLRIFLK